jgi:hypothetical protein
MLGISGEAIPNDHCYLICMLLSLITDVCGAVSVLEQLSQGLDCGLDTKQLALVMELLQNDTHPQALASVINQVREQVAQHKLSG